MTSTPHKTASPLPTDDAVRVFNAEAVSAPGLPRPLGAPFVAALMAATVGCADPVTSDSAAPPPDPGPYSLSDAGNFTYTSSIDLQTVQMAEFQDVQISWADLTLDMLGHDLAPATDIDTAGLVVFGDLTEADLEQAVATDSIPQSEVSLYLTLEPDGASASLGDFTMFGTDIDVETRFESGSGVWMLALATAVDGSLPQYRRLVLLEPTADGAASASLSDDMGMLQIDADLASRPPLKALADEPELVVDWASISLDGLGRELQTHKIDRLGVARYDTLSPSDLQDRFVDIDLLADDYWDADVGARTSATLSELTNGQGSFPGFSTGATWLLALRCSTCSTPMPMYLTVVSPQ